MRLTRWGFKISTGETNEIIRKFALVFASRISDATHRECLIAGVTSNNFHYLCDYSFDYANVTSNDASNIRQCLAFFQKRADLDSGHDRRVTAYRTFIESEALCRRTNELIQLVNSSEACFSRGVEPVIFTAQRKIADILGSVPKLADLTLKFGPGATTHVPKRTASAKRKLSTTLACSEDMLPIIKDCLHELPAWVSAKDLRPSPDSDTALVDLAICETRLSFVPKSSKTDRSIGVEPVLNSMFQTGVGSHISRQLKKVGIDLTDQTRNQRLAREGSLTGDLATLDLSSASDTVSKELVHLLLPVDWALFLDEFRCGSMIHEGFSFQLAKYSSMGNGYTFPLETLIFYGLALACVSEDKHHLVSVYGDDIIVPTESYEKLCEILRVLGFIPNLSKSFATGPFRESCGADYYKGISIRPCYIKDRLSGQDLYRLYNFFAKVNDEEACLLVLTFLDPSLHRFGPRGYGDGHLHSDLPLKPHNRGKGWGGYTFETYTYLPKKDFSVLPGDFVYPSYSVYANVPSQGVNMLNRRSLRDEAMVFKDEFPYSLGFSPYDERGGFGVSIPGRDRVNLIRVYVLS